MKKYNETDSNYIKRIMNDKEYECSGMQVILKAILNGIYCLGNSYPLNYYTEPKHVSLNSYPKNKQTDKVCHFLISYGKCSFDEVPEKARTRKFYLNAFSDKGVYDYIKNHIEEFDQEFFKDLITTNHYSLSFQNNAFEVMPLDYITTEMVDIAFLNATNWVDSDWFQSVVRRKPEVISYQAWLCATRYYTNVYNILNDIPDAYKTDIFYFELMSCTYNVGMPLKQKKEKTICNVGDDIFTPQFLKDLICLNISNVERIPEKYLDTQLDFKGKMLRVWEVCMLAEPETITSIQPTQERIDFFKNRYGYDTFYYRLYCKDIEEDFERKTA